MSLTVLGVDPGLAHAAFAIVTFGREEEADLDYLSPLGENAADEIATMIYELEDRGGIDAIAIEDYVWRPAKVHGHRQITNGLAMARMLGRLDVLLRDLSVPLHWVIAKDSLREQPFGAEAKRLGIPGRNDHERSAFYQARWLLGTLRVGGSF